MLNFYYIVKNNYSGYEQIVECKSTVRKKSGSTVISKMGQSFSSDTPFAAFFHLSLSYQLYREKEGVKSMTLQWKWRRNEWMH